MNISFQSVLNLNQIKKISNRPNFLNNVIAFRGNQKDEFHQSAKSPDTEFLYDESLNKNDKLRIIAEKENLYTANDIVKALDLQQALWLRPRFFEYDEINVNKTTGRKSFLRVFDTNNEINRKNLKTLQEVSKSAITSTKYRSDNNIPDEIYRRYIKEGLIEEVHLIDKKTGREGSIPLIDRRNKKNSDAIIRYNALIAKKGKAYKTLILAGKHQNVYASVTNLAKRGFGSADELEKFVKNGTLDGKITTKATEKGEEKVCLVNINNPNTQRVLRDIRNKQCITIDSLANRSGVPIKAIEDKVLSGEMIAISEKIFAFDEDSLLLDTKNPKNIEAFDKLILEKQIEDEIVKTQIENKKKQNRENMSLRMKITWQLCPKTKAAAGMLAKDDKEIQGLLDKLDMLKEILKDKDLEPEEKEAFEAELNALAREYDTKIKKFFKSMWSIAGTEEYNNAIKKAKEYISQNKTYGIDSIDDPAIKGLFLEHSKLGTNQEPLPFA